jgi:large subunit ribosomal protein L24
MGLAKIKTGDQVIVIAGKDRGRTGKVLRVLHKENRVVVERINMVKKHQRQTQTTQAGIVSKEAPIHLSNVMLMDDQKGGGVRTKVGTDKDGRKVRISKATDTVFD